MDFNTLIGWLQIALASFQLKLDHFSSSGPNRDNQVEEDFYNLGEAVRIIEYALSETVAFVGRTDTREANPRLSRLWEDASRSLNKIADSAELADITFEKHLYWRNPQFYQNRDNYKLYRISLENVLDQLRTLRGKYDKILKKIN